MGTWLLARLIWACVCASNSCTASSLSKEQFSDDLALTSMAKLWDVGRSEPIKVGKASPTEGTLPGAVYFILKYANEEDGLKKAIQSNTMVGGDNASRAIAIGMVLGAYKGIQAIPKQWKETLEQWEYCENLLNQLPLLNNLEKETSSSFFAAT